MYTNTVAISRLDLAGAIRSEEDTLDGYIAHEILPPMPVAERAASVPTVLVTDDQIIDVKHAPKTNYQRVEASLSDDSYKCEEAGIEEPMSAEDFDVLGQDRAEMLATQRTKGIILRARDAALAGILTGSAGETLFSAQKTRAGSSGITWDHANGIPVTDVADADAALGLRIGEGPRTLIIGQEVLIKLRKNAQIKASYRDIVGTSKADATYRKLSLEQLALVLSVDRILVGSGRKNTKSKGVAAVKAYIWPSTYALLVRGVINASDLSEPAFGRTMMWDGANIGAEGEIDEVDALYGLTVESYRDEKIKADVIRTTEYTDQKIFNLSSAQLIYDL
jgi:hypothetical protein